MSKKLIFALALIAFFAAPLAQAAPLCWETQDTETYYSDATYTTIVGSCVYNNCYLTQSCTGTVTQWVKYTWKRIPCNNCVTCFTCWGVSDAEQIGLPSSEMDQFLSEPTATPADGSCAAAA